MIVVIIIGLLLIGLLGGLFQKPSPTHAEREKLWWDWEHGRINTQQYFELKRKLDEADRQRS
jgi:hypothetical protein